MSPREALELLASRATHGVRILAAARVHLHHRPHLTRRSILFSKTALTAVSADPTLASQLSNPLTDLVIPRQATLAVSVE